MTIRLLGKTCTRVVDLAPSRYDGTARTATAVISMGSPVSRLYGTEVLRIHEDAVDVTRVRSGSCPVLDSHQQNSIRHCLGRVIETWFEGSAFMGTLAFNDTQEGRKAEGMVARGEITGVSAGYRVTKWEIADSGGRRVDPDEDVRWDEDLTFTATRWELLELSLVTVPADAGAGIRAYAGGFDRALVIADLSEDVQVLMSVQMRMEARQRMFNAHQTLFG